ncbi:MAG: hypothetical protein ACJ74Z_11990 [Bryobacteraceae bacterium]
MTSTFTPAKLPPRTDLGPLKKSYDAFLKRGPKAIREHFEAMKKNQTTSSEEMPNASGPSSPRRTET